ncbi:hypothetical protein A0H81_03214 [Grifola frondosa]|uniref:Uncharacterized protein n=1 Tax=Grifola frondosa TaxID=5627 RepID=A0A1C7MH10_GRIFR|nr:hypothetical protein A0H81_03214 [Grifola frondosa]
MTYCPRDIFSSQLAQSLSWARTVSSSRQYRLPLQNVLKPFAMKPLGAHDPGSCISGCTCCRSVSYVFINRLGVESEVEQKLTHSTAAHGMLRRNP